MAGSPAAPVTASVGRQVLLSTSSTGESDSARAPGTNGSFPAICASEHPGSRAGLLDAGGRNRDAELVHQQVAGHVAFDAREQRARDPENGRRDAGAGPGMHAFGEAFDDEVAHEVAAQRRRAPELLVVAAFGVEADDEARRADAVREHLDVVGQVVAPALLAGLDQHDAARVRDLLRLQQPDRRQRREHGVAVVGAAAPVELPVANDRFPGRQPVGPAGELRLLVHVPVQQHGVRAVARNLAEEERRAAWHRARSRP